MKQKSRKAKAEGNVTIDLGEEIEKRLGISGSKKRRSGGGYRPGMFGSYRPWYASRGKGASLGAKMGIPDSVNSGDLLTGATLGTLGNRVVNRIVAKMFPSLNSALAVNAINFGVGIIPFVAKKNATTVGIALPGFVYLGGTISDWLIDKVAGGVLPAPVLSGPGARPNVGDAAAIARQRLAEASHKIAQRQTQIAQISATQQVRPRVVS